jgi:hypothetical protein
VDLGPQSRSFTDAAEIDGEAVAQVHGGGGAQFLADESAERQPRFGAQVAPERLAGSRREPQCGPAERSGNVDGIARARPIAAQRAVSRDGAADDDIADGLGGVREIPAGQRRFFAAREAQQAGVEPLDPARVGPIRGCQRHQAEARLATHGGDVAQAAGEAFPADIARRLRGGPKMHVLDQHVGGKEQILAAAARAVDGAIVADSQHQRRNCGIEAGPSTDTPHQIDLANFG